MTDPKLTGWDVAFADDTTVIMLYDPATQQIKELGRWVGAKTYTNDAALLKGELGRMYGPTFKINPKDIEFKI